MIKSSDRNRVSERETYYKCHLHLGANDEFMIVENE